MDPRLPFPDSRFRFPLLYLLYACIARVGLLFPFFYLFSVLIFCEGFSDGIERAIRLRLRLQLQLRLQLRYEGDVTETDAGGRANDSESEHER